MGFDCSRMVNRVVRAVITGAQLAVLMAEAGALRAEKEALRKEVTALRGRLAAILDVASPAVTGTSTDAPEDVMENGSVLLT